MDDPELDDHETIAMSPKSIFKRSHGHNHNNTVSEEEKIDEILIGESMDECGMKIFSEYIDNGAVHEINLSSEVKKDLQKIFKAELYYKDKEIAKEYSIAGRCIADKFRIFDTATTEIENMLRKDTFARFKRTQEFKDFVKTWNRK